MLHRLRTATVVAAVLVVVAACDDRPPPAPASGPFRLALDAAARPPDAFLRRGGMVTIDGISRPVLTAAEPIRPATEIVTPPGEPRRVRAQVPRELATVPWVVFETVVTRAGTTSMMRSWPMSGRMQAGATYEIPVIEEQVGTDGTPGIRLWPIPDLAARDVDTREVVVPPHAVLTVGLGLEPISWDTTVLPVDMTVAAVVDGRETVLHTVQLNPRRREHRRWVDVSVPLDALTGQTARFVFRARPSMGSSAVPSLPVWADPTIVTTPPPVSSHRVGRRYQSAGIPAAIAGGARRRSRGTGTSCACPKSWVAPLSKQVARASAEGHCETHLRLEPRTVRLERRDTGPWPERPDPPAEHENPSGPSAEHWAG
jgi:hypothetical protein